MSKSEEIEKDEDQGLPQAAKKLPVDAKKLFKKALQRASNEFKNEVAAIKAAWQAVAAAGFKKKTDGTWVGASEIPSLDEVTLNDIFLDNVVLNSGAIQLIEQDEDSEEELEYNARIPLLRKTTLNHPFFGELKFDKDFFTQVLNNFYSDTLGVELSVDLNHNYELGAFGWVKDVEYDGKNFAVLVDLTDEGTELVKSRKFRYSSIEYDPDYVDPESGESYGPTMKGLALTNRPFVRRQEPARILSEDLKVFLGSILTDGPEIDASEDIASQEDLKTMNDEDGALEVQLQELQDANKALEDKLLAEQKAREEQEQERVRLQEQLRKRNVEAIVVAAESEVVDGKQMVPEVIAWAKNVLAGEAISISENETIELSEDNPQEYLTRAISYLLTIVPRTVPVQSQDDNAEDAEDENPALSEDGEDEEFRIAQAKAFWTGKKSKKE